MLLDASRDASALVTRRARFDSEEQHQCTVRLTGVGSELLTRPKLGSIPRRYATVPRSGSERVCNTRESGSTPLGISNGPIVQR